MNSTTHQIQNRQRPEEIQSMFDEIAPTYDLLNRLLSFGLDSRWRRMATRLLEVKRGGTFLDIAAGTGDVALNLLRLRPRRIIGADFALNMLRVFREKFVTDGRPAPIDLISCDALALPFRNETFDGTIVAFGIRNFANRLQSLQEMLRVLRPGGISIILELSTPSAPVISHIYRAYSRWGVPLIGRLISKSTSAYSYLPASIEQFPDAHGFLTLMTAAGFDETKAIRLAFGAATIYCGSKLSTV